MKVCVFGLWHLGTVTAACLAALGHEVVGLDYDEATVQNLQAGQPPIEEPGLEAALNAGLSQGYLRFTTLPAEAVTGAEIVWVTFDTPVDDEDRADFAFVIRQVESLFAYLTAGMSVLISSQLPVGTTIKLQAEFAQKHPGQNVVFAYSPENLRLGKALQTFMQPDRIVVGVEKRESASRINDLLQTITSQIEWMSIPSAEMTKHALNAFLATSITFINEVANLCEQVNADAQEVARGLKSDARIGTRAYLSPGAAFAGGTLARDVRFLEQVAIEHTVNIDLLSAITTSNDAHKLWAYRQLRAALGDLNGKTIAILGLTYKPNTNTLRRSSALELCALLLADGALVQAYDPAIDLLPVELAHRILLLRSSPDVFRGADAAVICTEWLEFKHFTAAPVVEAMRDPVIVDANRFLNESFRSHEPIRYYSVGKRDGIGE